MKHSPIYKLLSVFFFEFVLIIILAFITYQNILNLVKKGEENLASQELVSELAGLSADLNEHKALSRAYIITKEEDFRQEFEFIGTQIKYKVEKLGLNFKKSTIQKSRFDELKIHIDKRIEYSKKTIAVVDSAGFEQAQLFLKSREGVVVSRQIDKLISDIERGEHVFQKLNNERIHEGVRNTGVIFLLVLIGLLIVSIIIYYYIFRTLKKLEEKENELNISELKYKPLVESTNAIPWEVDFESFQFIYVGPQAERILGYPSNLWYEKDFWPHHIHPEDKDAALRYCMEAVRIKKNYDFEYRMIGSDGNIVWVHDIVNVEWKDDKPFKLRGFLIDITKTKEDQKNIIENAARMEIINRQLPAVIWSMDKDLKFTASFGKSLANLNLMADQVKGMSIYQYFGIEDENHPSIKAHKLALSGEAVTYEQTFGNYIWKSTVEPLKDELGEITGVIGMAVDVTDLKQSEQEEKERAERLVKFQSTLIDMTKRDFSDWNGFVMDLTAMVSEVMGVERVSVWLAREDSSAIISEDVFLLSKKVHEKDIELKATDYPAYFKSLDESRYVAANDAQNDHRTLEFKDTYLIPNDISSMLDAPFRYKAKLGGVVCLEHVGPQKKWSREEQEFAANIADLVSVAYESNRRIKAEKELKDAHDFLEIKVEERTKSLMEFNVRLANEIKLKEKAEEALKASEEKYRQLIETAGDVIYSTDFKGNFTFINERALALSGYTPNELLGKHFTFVIHPEWKETVIDFYQNQFKERTHETVFSFPIVTKSGQTKWVEQVVILLRDNGFVTGFQSVVRDITERKKAENMLIESENRIKTIINNAPDAVIMIDENSNVIEWNAKSEFVFGWQKHEVLGKPMYNYIMPERYRERHKAGLKKFLGTGEGPLLNKTIQIEAVRKNKTEFPIELNISPTQVEGKYLFISFLRDITSRKEAEQHILELNGNLENAVANLEVANKELESFTYSVSHDLRAPLRGINGFTKILEEEYGKNLDEEGRRLLDIVKSSAEKMGILIDDLLTFSRTGRQEIKKTEIDMDTLVQGTISEIEKNIEAPVKAKIIIKDLKVIKGDFNLIRQVVYNLLSNSIKFSAERENPEIEVGSYTKGDDVVYYFKDNGVGFDMKYYDKLFGVFQRLHTEEEFEGTGVGLAIVKRVIQRHGGKVWAESEQGKGATFYFSLPVLEEKLQEEKESEVLSPKWKVKTQYSRPATQD